MYWRRPSMPSVAAREPGAMPDRPKPAPSAVPEIGIDPIADLKKRDLRIPVNGVDDDDLNRSFADKRGGSRLHEAIDILAPRHTPVIAVEDGVLVKFFHSKAGGNTIYQFDPTSRYAYYYAHLDRYAAGLKEGDRVKKGQTIGHVGTTGNAPLNTPHLHFAIFRLTEQKQWWKGTPIDPFDVWR
jgi:murein DD-endopeptidase MepM/ murein hydrolase activator NlpD